MSSVHAQLSPELCWLELKSYWDLVGAEAEAKATSRVAHKSSAWISCLFFFSYKISGYNDLTL